VTLEEGVEGLALRGLTTSFCTHLLAIEFRSTRVECDNVDKHTEQRGSGASLNFRLRLDFQIPVGVRVETIRNSASRALLGALAWVLESSDRPASFLAPAEPHLKVGTRFLSRFVVFT
jgi:hypothetical protein